jgi:hypothetical protein
MIRRLVSSPAIAGLESLSRVTQEKIIPGVEPKY